MSDFAQRILEYLERLVSVPGITATVSEQAAADELAAILTGQEYFKQYPYLCGNPQVEGDSLKRTLPFGLVRGSSQKTIVLTGHYDVVGVAEYGPYKAAAFDMTVLQKRLLQGGSGAGELSADARTDLQSGEWLFGRGTADMKGGLAVGLSLLEEFGKQVLAGTVPGGNLLFLAVPDEESFSAGMRGALPVLTQLREQYGLEYDCLVDLEPSGEEAGGMQVHLGSAGKYMPVILVQGRKAHISACYDGINAIGVLGEFFNRTELEPAFADEFEGERCMPPTWLKFQDLKAEYDVSVPSRACGYINMITFSRSPERLMKELLVIGEQSWRTYLARMEASARTVLGAAGQQQTTGPEQGAGPEYPVVMGYGELLEMCRLNPGFEDFYTQLYEAGRKQIESGAWNYPQATIEFMTAVLDFSGLTGPVLVIGFAPPYYPVYHSDGMAGQEDAGSRIFEVLSECSRQVTGRSLCRKHYFTGISDLSYCGICKDAGSGGSSNNNERMKADYGRHTPLWGSLYTVDFAAVSKLQIPAVLYGPWGKDLHQLTERVNRKSLTVEVPEILSRFIEQMFAKTDNL